MRLLLRIASWFCIAWLVVVFGSLIGLIAYGLVTDPTLKWKLLPFLAIYMTFGSIVFLAWYAMKRAKEEGRCP